MKGLILAAGRGSRLLPLSATRPKHTLPVAGVPILARAVASLREAGVRDIGVVTSPGTERDLRDATSLSGALTFIHQPEALGTGHAVLAALDFLQHQPTLLYLGDNLFEDSLAGIIEALPGADAVLGVKRVTNPRAFGVAVVENGELRRLAEKPHEPESDLAACGVFAFQPHVLDRVASLAPSRRGEIEFPQVLSTLVAGGARVRAVEFGGFWTDAGTPADLLRADAHYLSRQEPRLEGTLTDCVVRGGPVVVEPGARVEGSTLVGPLWVGHHARVRGSVLGPNVSVGAHARVEGAKVQDSLLDDFAHIHQPHLPVQRAVIGRHAYLGPPSEGGLQLVLGDRSVVRR